MKAGLAALVVLVIALNRASAADLAFERVVVDARMAGDCKMAGDLDGDGQTDLIIGGMGSQEGLAWYRFPNWSKTLISTARKEFTTDGALGDVDGDADVDIIIPDGDAGENLFWFENPRPRGNPATGSAWKRHIVGGIGGWGKEVEPADYDGDGRLDVAVQTHGAAMIFFQQSPARWRKIVLRNVTLGGEGMGSGDIDGDGDVDLVLRGTWVDNPGAPRAGDPGAWREHAIGQAPNDFKSAVADINRDGRQDVLFSSSEGTADVQWWSCGRDGPRGAWTAQTIARSIERCHTVSAGDMDGDGDTDVVIGQMHTSRAGEIVVCLNADGRGLSWRPQVVDKGGVHNGLIADVGGDGDLDIFAVNWTGNPPARLYVNQLRSRPSGPARGPGDRRPAPATRPGARRSN